MKLQLKLQGDHIWILEHPKCVHDNEDKLWKCISKMQYKPRFAEHHLKEIIEECQGVHLQAMSELAYLYIYDGRVSEGRDLIRKAYAVGAEAIPDTFNQKIDNIPWQGYMLNRPLLSIFNSMGTTFMEETQYEKAIELFRFSMDVNLHHSYDAGIKLQKCFFHLKQPEKVLLLHKSPNDSWSMEFAYGVVLANLQIGKFSKAKAKLKKAISEFSEGAEEIIRKVHTVLPEKGRWEGYASGGEYDAFQYWKQYGEFWEETEGAIEWIRANY